MMHDVSIAFGYLEENLFFTISSRVLMITWKLQFLPAHFSIQRRTRIQGIVPMSLRLLAHRPSITLKQPKNSLHLIPNRPSPKIIFTSHRFA